jgi:hypothetical protein
MAIVRQRVKPERDRHPKRREREEWWKLSRTVRDLFEAVQPLPRFIACPATSKRIAMVWCESGWCPGNATSVFAFDDDYAFGLLSSSVHTRWATRHSTKLETRPRYTVNSFATYPWPQPPSPPAQDEIAGLGRLVNTERGRICAERQIGLTTLYNAVEQGAHVPLRHLHEALDEAVATAYGWPSEVAHDPEAQEDRLVELNLSLANG